ncbi:MAG TPA: hypothetical protein VFN53_08925 [Acidobacteriaceae bacterium]|nr:hypothetical protein [Acidobacteriaceae bacterium]
MNASKLSTEPMISTKTHLEPLPAEETTIFKVPIGRLGLLASVLIGGATGVIAFLLTFFLAIIGVVIYDSSTGKSMLNLDISYRYIAAPVGILVMLVSLTYLIAVWARRKIAGRE